MGRRSRVRSARGDASRQGCIMGTPAPFRCGAVSGNELYMGNASHFKITFRNKVVGAAAERGDGTPVCPAAIPTAPCGTACRGVSKRGTAARAAGSPPRYGKPPVNPRKYTRYVASACAAMTASAEPRPDSAAAASISGPSAPPYRTYAHGQRYRSMRHRLHYSHCPSAVLQGGTPV